MPEPPKKKESQKDFVGRCIPYVLNEGTTKDQDQAVAMCYSMYRESKVKKADGIDASLEDLLKEWKLKKGSSSKSPRYTVKYFQGLRKMDLNFIVDFADVTRNFTDGSVLDIGCGMGRELNVLKSSGFEVTGIDKSRIAIELCKDNGLDVGFGKAENLPFEDGQFDNVFTMHTLEHVDDAKKAIEESVRVAKSRVVHLVPLGKSKDRTHKSEFASLDDLKKLITDMGMDYVTRYSVNPLTKCATVVIFKDADKTLQKDDGEYTGELKFINIQKKDEFDFQDSIAGKEEGEVFKREVKILKVDEDRREIFGVVMEPDETDSQGDASTAEEIEKACHDFMINYRKQVSGMGFMHKKDVSSQVYIIQNYTAPVEFKLGEEKVKKGSWVMGSKVNSDAMWKLVKEGKLTGYSVGGRATASV